MSFSLIGTTTPSGEGVSSTVTTAVPTHASGDKLYWVIRTRQYDSGTHGTGNNIGTTPSGWTRVASAGTIGSSTNAADIAMGVYSKTASGSEPSDYTAGPFGSGYQQGAMFAYRDAELVGSAITWSTTTESGAISHQTGNITLSSPMASGHVLFLNACGWQNNIWTSGGGTELWKQNWFYGRQNTGVTSSSPYTPVSATHSADWNHEYVSINLALTAAGGGSTTVNGTQATETDSGQAGSATVGAVKAGTQATETDAVQAGTLRVGVTVAGGMASETDQAQAGSASANAVVVGTLSTEADAVLSGTSTVAAVIAGEQAAETDAAQAGSVSSGVVIPGTQATEADSGLTGSTTAGALVSGSQALETDAGQSGAATVGVLAVGSMAAETDAAQAGSVVESGTWFPVDLSTFVDLYSTATWDGTRLSGSPMYFTFADLVVDPSTEYQVEVDYDHTGSAFPGSIDLVAMPEPTEAGSDAAVGATLDSTTGLAGTGTASFAIGPGINDWAMAMSAGEQFFRFVATNLHVTGIRVSPAMDAEPPTPVYPGSDLTRAGGRTRSGYAVATWTPPVVAPPSPSAVEHRRIRGAAFGTVTMVGTQPTYTVSKADAQRLRTRILMGGKDISFLDDTPTPEPEWQLAEPLLWGPSSVELPSIPFAFFDPADYPWCAKGKPVVYQRVDAAGNIVGIDYRGVVMNHGANSEQRLRVEVGGHAQGRAQFRIKPSPRFRDTLDLGRHAWAWARDMSLRFFPRLGPATGIKHALFGGSDFLSYGSEICAKASDFSGQWSIMPDESALYTFALKDTETVHWTLFNDDVRTVADLRSDAANEPNRIFATGVTPKGQRVMFGVYPGLEPGPAAPYPFDDDSTFGLGTTDGETDTGDGVTVMVKRLWTAGYLSLEDATGLYDAEVTRAIMSLQSDAGLTVTGNMNPNTWDALFDVETTGYTLRGARIEPAAQDYRVRRYNRSSSGAIIGKNPNFDPHRLIVDREIDFGSGFTRHQMRDHSRNEVELGQVVNWEGTITITQGAILRGDITPGTVIDDTDLADVREIRPGQNVSLPQFCGGTLLHIAGVEITRGENGHPLARLTVDTRGRDAVPIWQSIKRQNETRRDPARRWKGNRASGVIKDSIDVWDEVGGVVAGDRPLVAGWNIVEVVGGQEGTVSRIRLRVSAEAGVEGDPVEFACAVFGKQVTAARLNGLVPAPLTTEGEEAWEDDAVRTILDKKKQVYSAGTTADPCGYSPGRKSRGGSITGKHADDAGFSYRTDREPILYLAVWVEAPAVLEGGRVMWPQLEAGA